MADAFAMFGIIANVAVAVDAFEVMKATKALVSLRKENEDSDVVCQQVTRRAEDQFCYPKLYEEDGEFCFSKLCLEDREFCYPELYPEDEDFCYPELDQEDGEKFKLSEWHRYPIKTEPLGAMENIRGISDKSWDRIDRWECDSRWRSDPMERNLLPLDPYRHVPRCHDEERRALKTPIFGCVTMGEESFGLKSPHHTRSDEHNEAVRAVFETGPTMKRGRDLARSSAASDCIALTELELAMRDRRCFARNCKTDLRFDMLDNSCLLLTKIMIPPLQWLFLHSLQLEPYSPMDRRILRAMPMVTKLIDALRGRLEISWVLMLLATTTGIVALSRPMLSALRNSYRTGGDHVYMALSSISAMVLTALYWAYESGSALDFFMIGMPLSVSVGISLSFMLRYVAVRNTR